MFAGEDGVTHINIYSQGKTELGRLMSNWAYTNIEMEGTRFASVEAYWYWLGINLDPSHPEMNTFRFLYGFDAKRKGRELKKQFGEKKVADFEKRICLALREKIRTHPRLRLLLVESTFPFDHYYVAKRGNGARIDAGFKWQVEEWEKIRRELKDGTFSMQHGRL